MIVPTHLECGTIFNQILGNMLANLYFLRGWWLSSVVREWGVNINSIIEVRDVDLSITESARHVRVDLS